VADAVFGNVGTIVSFRVGGADSEILAKEFSPVFLEEDIVNLSKYRVLLKLMIDGVASQPFSAMTLNPVGKPTDSREKIIRVSRERYGKPREQIEEKIIKWSGMAGGDDDEDDDETNKPNPKNNQEKKITDQKSNFNKQKPNENKSNNFKRPEFKLQKQQTEKLPEQKKTETSSDQKKPTVSLQDLLPKKNDEPKKSEHTQNNQTNNNRSLHSSQPIKKEAEKQKDARKKDEPSQNNQAPSKPIDPDEIIKFD